MQGCEDSCHHQISPPPPSTPNPHERAAMAHDPILTSCCAMAGEEETASWNNAPGYCLRGALSVAGKRQALWRQLDAGTAARTPPSRIGDWGKEQTLYPMGEVEWKSHGGGGGGGGGAPPPPPRGGGAGLNIGTGQNKRGARFFVHPRGRGRVARTTIRRPNACVFVGGAEPPPTFLI